MGSRWAVAVLRELVGLFLLLGALVVAQIRFAERTRLLPNFIQCYSSSALEMATSAKGEVGKLAVRSW